MAQLVLTRLPPAALAKLEERARTLGLSTPEIAERLLLQALEEDEIWTTGADGLPLYKGPIDPSAFDHRVAREERIDHLMRGFGEDPR
ncbi:MAG: hypothetical protein MUF64_20670 [Polyangiaceae bacterium]|jgi:hypothetical protein|nr:hypothetical protein [Polyangiaceae bacterium]